MANQVTEPTEDIQGLKNQIAALKKQNIAEESGHYGVTTIAAHNDLDPLADLSPEARRSVEDYIEYARKKYPKEEGK